MRMGLQNPGDSSNQNPRCPPYLSAIPSIQWDGRRPAADMNECSSQLCCPLEVCGGKVGEVSVFPLLFGHNPLAKQERCESVSEASLLSSVSLAF